MPAKDKLLQLSKNERPIPQYFNPTADEFEPLQGKDGASFVSIKNQITPIALITDATATISGEIASTKESKIALEFYHTGTATTGVFETYIVGPSGIERKFNGFRKTGEPDLVNSFVVGDIATFTIPAGFKLRVKLISIAGGGKIDVRGTIE